MSWKQYYTHVLDRADAPLHFAAHSHHPWPDISRAAHLRAWDDAARLLDGKWGPIFGEIKPRLQQRIADILKLPDPDTLAFAPNTHEFVLRLLSCLPADRPARILTTDSEFHSFNRQITRLEEDGLVTVTRLPTSPYEDYHHRLEAACATGGWDMIFVSQVFFNSGFAPIDLEACLKSVPDEDTLIVIDGYHGFMAVPTDLSGMANRVFYMSGGYKYAQSGEGACFLHCPPGYGPRPRNTGWMAAFAALADEADTRTPYAINGERFTGATFDPSGLYRMEAVLTHLAEHGPDVEAAQEHCLTLQRQFLNLLDERPTALTPAQLLLDPRAKPVMNGRFLTFHHHASGALYQALLDRNIITDHRGPNLRIGFGIYQDADDVSVLIQTLAKINL